MVLITKHDEKLKLKHKYLVFKIKIYKIQFLFII